MKNIESKVSRLLIFFIIYTLIFLIFFKTLTYTLPFVLAALFALILRKPTIYLIKKFRMKDWVASLITSVIFLSLLIIMIVILIASLTNQLINLTKSIQAYFTVNSAYIADKFMQIQDYFYNLNIDPVIINSIKDTLNSFSSKIVSYSVALGSVAVSMVISVFSYVPYILMVIIFTFLATYMFTKKVASSKNESLLSNFYADNNSILAIVSKIKDKFITYALSYLFLVFVTFLITFVGFSIFKIKYSLILSVICAILDLLPILGMPILYFPLIIYYALTGNLLVAIGLAILYAIVFISRQVLEPKVMSTSLGLDPIAVLAALFIGVTISGIGGMIFCMFLVVFYTVLKDEKVL